MHLIISSVQSHVFLSTFYQSLRSTEVEFVVAMIAPVALQGSLIFGMDGRRIREVTAAAFCFNLHHLGKVCFVCPVWSWRFSLHCAEQWLVLHSNRFVRHDFCVAEELSVPYKNKIDQCLRGATVEEEVG